MHDSTIFPEPGFLDEPENFIYNQPLEANTGDEELAMATKRFIDLCESIDPTILFIACGADAHKEDPLSSLQFTDECYKQSMNLLANNFKHLPILFGGAGGYLPDTCTPLV